MVFRCFIDLLIGILHTTQAAQKRPSKTLEISIYPKMALKHRFYCPLMHAETPCQPPLSGLLIPLDRQQAHHAKRVLRLEPNDKVELFDGQGTVGQGVLVEEPNGLRVKLTEVHRVAQPTPTLDIAVATPKGPRAGDMVNQLSQLGANRYIPLQTHRGVVRPKPGKLEHLQRIAIESAKQSQRAHLMTLGQSETLEAVLGQSYDLRLIAQPPSPQTVPKTTHQTYAQLANRITPAKRVLILIGPEGGWTDDELKTADQAGCLVWRLGPHVLRVETAATAAVAIVRHMALPHPQS